MDFDTIQLVGQGLAVLLTAFLAIVGSSYQTKKQVANATTDFAKKWEDSIAEREKQAAKIARLVEQIKENEARQNLMEKEHIEERGGLKRELKLVREELEKVRHERDDYFTKWTEERVETRTQITVLEKQVEQLQGKVAKLESDLLKTQQEKDELLRELNKRISDAVQAATKELNSEIETLKKQIEEKDRVIAELKKRLGEE